MPKSNGTYFSRFLAKTDGGIAANIAGTLAAPVEFKYTSPDGQVTRIGTLRVQIRDSGGLSPTKYGSITSLTNGLRVLIRRASGAEEERTLQRPIKSSGDWLEYATTSEIHSWGADPQTLLMRVEFFNHEPLVLYPGDSYVIQIRDDLTGLEDHTFRIRGTQMPKFYYN